MSEIANAWFYAAGHDRKGPFDPAEVKALIRAGVLTEHTKMWSETQPDWTPLFKTELRTLLPQAVIGPPPLPAEGGVPQARHVAGPVFLHETAPARGGLLYDNRTLAQVVRALIWVNFFASIIQVGVIAKARGGLEGQYRVAVLLEDERLAMVLLALFAAAAIPFLWLQYRSTANLVVLRGRQSVTPAGAVYWYFVPIAWFWKPYEAMRNLVIGFGSAERAWVGIWWALYWGGLVVAVIVAGIVASMERVETIAQAQFYVWSSVAVYLVDAAWMASAATLVKSIASAETTAIEEARHGRA